MIVYCGIFIIKIFFIFCGENIVFIEYDKIDKVYNLLKSKFVDTGMGFERLVAILQNQKSNYDTDLFRPIMYEISRLTNEKPYDELDIDIEFRLIKAYRVVADHFRCIIACLGDGINFGISKRESVLRKIYRRAQYYCEFVFSVPDLMEKLFLSNVFQNICEKEFSNDILCSKDICYQKNISIDGTGYNEYMETIEKNQIHKKLNMNLIEIREINKLIN